MSSDYVHIVRPDAQRPQYKAPEVLCGYVQPKGGNRVSGPPSMATCWRCILLQCGRPIPAEPALPEHRRLEEAKKTNDATQLIGAFLEWLGEEKRIVLAAWGNDSELYPAREPVQGLLAEYFGINQNALEAEKMALLEHLRATNKAREWAETEGKKTLQG